MVPMTIPALRERPAEDRLYIRISELYAGIALTGASKLDSETVPGTTELLDNGAEARSLQYAEKPLS